MIIDLLVGSAALLVSKVGDIIKWHSSWIVTGLLMLGLILIAMAYGAALGHIVEVMVMR